MHLPTGYAGDGRTCADIDELPTKLTIAPTLLSAPTRKVV